MRTDKIKAFLFDLNGTMIDDMDFHTDAWFELINGQLGGQLSREAVKMEMYGKNQEVLVRVFGEDRFSMDEMNLISFEKEKRYQEAYRSHLRLIAGLDDFLEKAFRNQIRMAIGSAAITFNVDFVLDGLEIRKYFPVVVSADHVTLSKPHPETFLLAAEGLSVQPGECIVFEDNPKGVEAARRAGMNTVVLTTMHEEHEFAGLPNILGFISDYNDPLLKELFPFE
jgi:beta-phosphoglucomutase